jgi:serine phosphatase RsbU (regulator of sigma subunit)
MFGTERLKNWLLNCTENEITKNLLEQLADFSEGKSASDDISIMSVGLE